MEQTDENQPVNLHCLSEHYGIEGSIFRLAGEDMNYLVRSRDSQRFVLKNGDDYMPAQIVQMEDDAIEYSISHGISCHFSPR